VASSARSPELAIREYNDGDQAGFEQLVTSVHQEFGFEYAPALDADLTDPRAFYIKTWVLAAPDGSIGGSAALRESGDDVELKRMYLKAELRGLGYGRSLLETATEWARDAGYVYIQLETAVHLTLAQRLYERAGFELVRRSNPGSGPQMLYYRLALEPRHS
jgi:GNAT superfamily N-acetyltransferase